MVRRPNGDRIGHIERLMIDKVSGRVSYAILSFGGFLGMGTNLLPLPWGRLSYNPRFEAYQLGIRLGRSLAGSGAPSLLRNPALLGWLLIARKPRMQYRSGLCATRDQCSTEPGKDNTSRFQK